MNISLLERLCNAHGVSGYENEVFDTVIEEIYPYADNIFFDKIGNLIAFKKGSSSDRKILYSCHADEVGFVINHINPDGTLSFDAIGMSPHVFCGKRVIVGKNKIPGIIATKPIHLIPKDERDKISADDMYIDIGAAKEQVEALSVVSDYAAFDTAFSCFGKDKILAKALDDRIGCAVACELIKREHKYDSYFAFCVCEELGLRGSHAVAERIRPDLCINLESTTANDIPGKSGAEITCVIGAGPVIPFMDGSAVFDKTLYKKALSLAEQNGIRVQTKTQIAGGTDAASYQKAGGGIKVFGIALPTRYIHSCSSVASLSDIECMMKLACVVSENTDLFIGG